MHSTFGLATPGYTLDLISHMRCASVRRAYPNPYNAEGHRNRAGREWLPQMVRHVLKAPERERLFRASISFSGNPGVTSPATLAERRRLT